MSGNAVQAGRDKKLYYNSASTYASPTYVLIDRVGDVNRSGQKATTDVDMRASENTITVYGNMKREITFTYYKKKGANDTVFNKLLDSYENNTVLDIVMADGPIATAGTVYDRGPFIVSQMELSEPIAGVDSYAVTMNFADAERSAGVPFLYESNVEVD
jgi:hypothetical protein